MEADAAAPLSRAFSLLDPAVQDSPFDVYRLLQAEAPVYRMPETGFYVVTRYEDVRQVLKEADTFRNAMPGQRGLAGERNALYQQLLGERGWAHQPTLTRCDGAEHARYRKLVDRIFTVRRVREMTPHIEAVCHEIIDRFIDRGECEFVHDFALQLPGMIIAEELGLDRSAVSTLKRWGDAFVALRSRLLTEDEVRAVAEIELECQHHLAEVFEARRREPRGDILSGLVHAHQGDEAPLSMAELQGIAAQLLTAGFETTMNAIAHGLWLLLRVPDQMARLRAEPGLMKGFVEETLRIESPVQGLLRLASRDAEIAGVPIPEGSIVMARFGAANHDAQKFACPHQFDVGRENASSHFAFGAGVHFCLGALLAKQQMVSGFTIILDRMTDIELARPLPAPAHEPSFILRPLKELPIRFRKVR